MLKHCSPATNDLRLRSGRREAYAGQDGEDDVSLRSSSPAVTGVATQTNITLIAKGKSMLRDASVSPMTSAVRRTISKPEQWETRSTAIKVYASCLSSDIEYKTLCVGPLTTSRQLIRTLLSKYRMRHRDPKLFYLTMDISIRRTGIPLRRTLVLDDDSKPAELQSCHPWGECKFTLQMRKGGLVRVHDSVLMPESNYKCLLISEQTTASEVVRLLFRCNGLKDADGDDDHGGISDRFCLCERSAADANAERRLASDERPVLVQSAWSYPGQNLFVLRRVHDDDDDGDGQKGKRGRSHSGDLDTSYGSDSNSSSEFSALRFRDSPVSASTRQVFHHALLRQIALDTHLFVFFSIGDLCACVRTFARIASCTQCVTPP
jgi:hypothetical protein